MSKFFIEGKFEVLTSNGDSTICYETQVCNGSGSRVARKMEKVIRDGLSMPDGVRITSVRFLGFRRVG